jgi:hypothetical protein
VEWFNEVKLSPSLSLDLDEEYATRRDDEDMDRTSHMRDWEEDLIWHNYLEMEERNLNQHARQLNICEAHLCRQKHRCDRHQADLRAARVRGIEPQ